MNMNLTFPINYRGCKIYKKYIKKEKNKDIKLNLKLNELMFITI